MPVNDARAMVPPLAVTTSTVQPNDVLVRTRLIPSYHINANNNYKQFSVEAINLFFIFIFLLFFQKCIFAHTSNPFSVIKTTSEVVLPRLQPSLCKILWKRTKLQMIKLTISKIVPKTVHSMLQVRQLQRRAWPGYGERNSDADMCLYCHCWTHLPLSWLVT